MNDIYIRVATSDDAEALLTLYAPYVTETAISFEYDVPTVDEFRARIVRTLTNYPYLVAEAQGEVLGVRPMPGRRKHPFILIKIVAIKDLVEPFIISWKLSVAYRASPTFMPASVCRKRTTTPI